jgi:hypothetical protein
MALRLMVTLALGVSVLAGPATAPLEAPQTRADRAPDIAELWVSPADLEQRDLFNGPWGAALAPDPRATYRFIEPKRGGVNPGMTVRDPQGRRWKVKQPPRSTLRNSEGPIEVVLSRVLSAVGYHQPPVYFVPSFLVEKDGQVRRVPGGRFRLSHPDLDDVGEWRWLDNPHTNTWEQRGLLVILLMFNSSDLKDKNNALYEHKPKGSTTVRRWYVVRDLGTALGHTGRISPARGDVEAFENHGFIRGVDNGFVEFHYGGRHEELYLRRITPGDVVWASRLLARLSPGQWRDAFRAGGYQPARADRYIRRLQQKIQDGLQLAPGLPGGPTAARARPTVIFPATGEIFPVQTGVAARP